jgi:hypothetical protein
VPRFADPSRQVGLVVRQLDTRDADLVEAERARVLVEAGSQCLELQCVE